jgi:hypothetical protein
MRQFLKIILGLTTRQERQIARTMRVSLKEYRRERWARYWHGAKKPHEVESMTEEEFDTEVDKLIRGDEEEKK